MYNIELILVLIYLFSTLILGIFSGRKVNTFRDYAVGKKNLPTIVVGMTICATLIGGGSSLGTSTEVYKFGIIVMFAKYGVSLGALITGIFFIPKIEKFMGKLSVGEIVEEMYGKKVRIITGICGALLSLGRVTAQMMAIGFVMQYIFGLTQSFGTICGALVIIIYSTFGGVRSVVFTDVLQFIALSITIPIVLNLALKNIGGYQSLFSMLPEDKISLYPSKEIFFKYLMVFFYMGIPMMSPPLVQRVLMSKSTRKAKQSFIFLSVTDMLFTTISGLLGLTAYVINKNMEANTVLLNLITELSIVGYGLKAMAIIGLLSVIMSTADSYLNTLSVSIVHDILLPFKIITNQTQELYSVRIVTAIFGVVSTLITMYFDNIFELAIYFSNFWGPVVVGPLILGLCEIKINQRACLIAMFVGFSTFLFWEYFQLKSITNIYSIIPSVSVNIITSMGLAYIHNIKNNQIIISRDE